MPAIPPVRLRYAARSGIAARILCGALMLTLAGWSLGCGGSASTVKRSRPETGSESYATLSQHRKLVVSEAKGWLGVPYAYGGSTRRGLDCSGLVMRVFERVGLVLPRTARDLFAQGRVVPMDRLRPGDLVFFRNTAGRGITHVGIFIGRSQFIHASTRLGVITTDLADRYYANRFAGARALLK